MAQRSNPDTYPTYKITAFIQGQELGPRQTVQYMEMLEEHVTTMLKNFSGVMNIGRIEVVKQITKKAN